MTAIDYGPEVATDEPTIFERPGYRQVTPRWADRYYEETVGRSEIDGEWFDPTTQHFTSVTSVLGKGVVTDWTGPTKANQAKWTWEHRAWLASLDEEWRDEALKRLRESSGESLDLAAERGSAVHRALEAIMQGHPVDRDDLVRNGAIEYLLAIENFVRCEQPRPLLIEVACFDREANVAGTCDFVGYIKSLDGILVLDWKSRTGGHDRRTKEAVQVAAYARMLEHRYYLNHRGQRCRQPIDGCGVVTFAPDGTYAVHPVDRAAADDLYDVALAMAGGNKVSNLYGKARKAGAPDVNALAMERLAVIPDGTPERMMLASRWAELGLGKPSAGGLTVEDWPVADACLAEAEGRFKAFEQPLTADPVYAGMDEIAVVHRRYLALPADLRELADLRATGLPKITISIMTTDEVEDWHRVLAVVEEDHVARQQECLALFNEVRELLDPARTAMLAQCPEGVQNWTRLDLERIWALLAAFHAGHLTPTEDFDLVPCANQIKTLAAPGKRTVVTACAERAVTLGLEPPRKWADLVADPVLFAVACGH